MDDRRRGRPPYSESLREYGRGLGGGLLFSLPLLYTMEVWWTGFIAGPIRLLAYIAATFVLLLGYNTYAGMRHDADWADVAIDSVEEFGLGVVTAVTLLAILGRITADMTFQEVLGKVVVESGIAAIGFSVGTAQLGGNGETSSNRQPHAAGQAVIALCGAVLIGSNIAPTEEILLIASEIGPIRLLLLVAASVLLGMLVLFFSDFARANRYARAETIGQAVRGGIITYAVAVIAAAASLWFFGRFHGAGVEIAVAQIVVLALPATLGASAGRLLLQS